MANKKSTANSPKSQKPTLHPSRRVHCLLLVVRKTIGGEGGLIAVDKKGNVIMPFNSDGMYRACCKPGDELLINIF